MAPLPSTTSPNATLSAPVFGHSQKSPSSSSIFKSDSSHSITSGSSHSFGRNSSLPSHIQIFQTNMNNKDQELAVKLMLDAVKQF